MTPRAALPSLLFAIPTFVGALLLFVVEPMLAKWLLPTLGGSPATWAACMVSFQALLLAGYAYAHLGSLRLPARAQVALHAFLVLFATISALGVPSGGAPVLPALPPALAVPWLIVRVVGLPFVVLASTAPLLQRWAALTLGRSPYSLYAVSNAGALIGLLGYPFVVEPWLGVDAELAWWERGFAAFGVALLAACALVGRTANGHSPGASAARAASAAPAGHRISATPALHPAQETRTAQGRWLVYALVPSVMLLAATNHITIDVAATPLLWVVPLALYLVSFIVAFGGWRASWRGPVLLVWSLSALGLGMNAFAQGAAPLWRQLGATLLALFSSCLLCHGELALERPAPEGLTRYYLIIAIGGALGGVLVSVVAPMVFADYYELEFAALGTFSVLFRASRRAGEHAWSRGQRLGMLLGMGLSVPLLATNVVVRMQAESRQGQVVERRRSFLGPLRVVDLPGARVLAHGRIQHGMQLRDPALRRMPTMYFGPGTALALVMEGHHPARARRIGVVGLGVGTIAAYGRPGDVVRFYEFDQNVVDVARRDFTFLADSAARIEITVGDGRLSLAGESPQAFDVLVLDAFSSDSVPVHLLTREAFSVYLGQLAPDGVLLLNVSNRHLAVDRVVRGSARFHGLTCALIETPTDAALHVTHVEWALVAREASVLEEITHGAPLRPETKPDVLWTDNRASVLSILR